MLGSWDLGWRIEGEKKETNSCKLRNLLVLFFYILFFLIVSMLVSLKHIRKLSRCVAKHIKVNEDSDSRNVTSSVTSEALSLSPDCFRKKFGLTVLVSW